MNTDNQVSELQAFSESIFKINEELSLLATLGGGPPEPEFNQWIKTAVQDLQILLPCVRRIYEARKDQWFEQNNVLKHGYCYAQTWHELVLNSAVEFIEGVRLIGAGHACKLLRESEYESGRVQIHLKLEIAHAGKAISQAGRKTDADRTQKKNSAKNQRAWDANCKRMAKAYIRQCVKDGAEIARLPFITEELRKNRTNYPNAKKAATINKAFQSNPNQWKPALSEALSGPDANRTH